MHPSNADDPMILMDEVTIEIFTNDKQFLKELLGICWISPMIDNDVIPWKASFSIVLIEDDSDISFNDEHPSKADDPIDFNEFAFNIIFFNDSQFLNELSGIFSIFPLIVNATIPWNALSSIVCNDAGSEISIRDLHWLNAQDPIEIKLSVSNVILDKCVQESNVLLGICWISPLIVNSLIPKKELYSIDVIDEGIVISFNDEHPSKLWLSIVLNEEGIDIFSIDVHSLKIDPPILWIDDGIMISFNNEHPSNADDLIETILSLSKTIFVKDLQFLNE